MMRFLVLLFIFGSLHSPAFQSGVTTSAPNENNDYQDYSDESDQNSAPSHMETRWVPYFEKNETTVYAKLNTTAKLDCPVKNYNASQHVIMWYKEKTPITNGNKVIQNIYRVDNQFSLIIEPMTNTTIGNYYCYIMPNDVRALTVLKLGVLPKAIDSSPPASSAPIALFAPSFLTLSIGIALVLNIKGNAKF